MSDNLSGPQQSDSLKYNGKYDSSKFNDLLCELKLLPKKLLEIFQWY